MKLYNGDCLEVMQDIPDNSIDFILTDLPYGTTACKWDFVIPYQPMWKELIRIRKDNTPIGLFGLQPFTTKLINSNIKEYKYDWIWNKKQAGNPLIAKYQPLKIYEFIHIFGKGKIKYYPIMRTGKMRVKGSKNNMPKITGQKGSYITKNNQYYPTAILEFSNANKKNKLHPTQKPVALLEYLIKTYTKENEVVLDFTMGSGSTGVACVNTNRNFIGIELDQEYYKIAKERIDEKLYNNTS